MSCMRYTMLVAALKTSVLFQLLALLREDKEISRRRNERTPKTENSSLARNDKTSFYLSFLRTMKIPTYKTDNLRLLPKNNAKPQLVFLAIFYFFVIVIVSI